MSEYSKTIAIMQPYFLPYIGYWQLIAAVDEFVIYDHIKYTKKGWINRNRFLQNGKDDLFSLPLKSASDSLDVCERELSDQFDREQLIRKFEHSYKKAPYFHENFVLIETILRYPEQNLFEYIFHSVMQLCGWLDIKTRITISSTVGGNHSNLKSQDKVLAICKELGATRYMNPIGGTELYNSADFAKENLELKFLKAKPMVYDQFGSPCIPHLSILDIMMFNAKESITDWLSKYTLEKSE